MHKDSAWLCIIVLLLVSIATAEPVTGQSRTLVINDRSGKVAVLQVGDATYIDLKQLVQIARGSISFEETRIVLDVPCGSVPAPPNAAQTDRSANMLLSTEFRKAAIESISLMREWASTLGNALQNGYPVSDSWVNGYRAQAQSGLALTSAAASTDGDREGFRLLNAEFDNVQAWSNKLLEARKSMDAAKYALSPDGLRNEPHSQKIVSCGRFLEQMLVNGNFHDDASCH